MINRKDKVKNLQELKLNALENIPLSILLVKPNLQLIYANRYFCKRAGKTKNNLLGRRITQILSPSFLEGVELYKKLEEALKNGKPFFSDKMFYRGSYYSCTIIPVKGKSGKYPNAMVLLQNITKMCLLEQEVAYLKQFQENIIDSIPTAIIVFDADLKVLSANRTTYHIFGWTKEDILGKTLYEIFPVRTVRKNRLDIAIRKVLKEKIFIERKEIPFFFPGLGKKILNFQFTSFTFDKRHEAISLMDDVTEKVHTGERLRHAERMYTIGILAAGVAHEVNNPLSIVSGHSQYLLKELMNMEPGQFNHARYKEFLEAMEVITKESLRAGKMLKRLLDFSHRPAPVVEPLKIDLEIRHSLHVLRRLFHKKGIQVVEKYGEGLPEVKADRDDLHQVFINILNNAIDASPPKGGRIEIRTEFHEPNIKITFNNTGIRILKENLPHVFDPFFTTKDVGKGTGLGLFIVYSIIKAHGGTIEVESSRYKGTTFTIMLPIW